MFWCWHIAVEKKTQTQVSLFWDQNKHNPAIDLSNNIKVIWRKQKIECNTNIFSPHRIPLQPLSLFPDPAALALWWRDWLYRFVFVIVVVRVFWLQVGDIVIKCNGKQVLMWRGMSFLKVQHKLQYWVAL